MSDFPSINLQELTSFAQTAISAGFTNIANMSLKDIEQQILRPGYLPLSASLSSSSSSLLSSSTSCGGSSKDVMYMVSLSPHMTFACLLELSLDTKQFNHRERSYRFWIDTFSLIAGLSPVAVVAAYKEVTKYCGDKVLLFSPWDHPEVFSNSLSIFQLYMASSAHKGWIVSLCKQEKQRLHQRLGNDSIKVERSLLRHINLNNIINDAVDPDERLADAEKSMVAQAQKLLGLTDSTAVEDAVVRSIGFGIKQWLLGEMMSAVASTDSSSITSISESDSAYSTSDNLESYLIYCIEEEMEVFQLGQELSRKTAFVGTDLVYVADESQLVSFLQSLGELFISQKRYEEAENIFLRVLQLHQQELGPCNLTTLTSTLKIADVFAMSKKNIMASLFSSTYLEGMEGSVIVNTRQLLITKQHVANFFYVNGDYEKAEELHEACYLEAETHYGLIHHVTLHARNMLATVKYRLGKLEEAVELAKDNVAIATSLYPSNADVVKQYEMLSESIQNMELIDHSSNCGDEELVIGSISMQYSFRTVIIFPSVVHEVGQKERTDSLFSSQFIDVDPYVSSFDKENLSSKNSDEQRSSKNMSVTCIIA